MPPGVALVIATGPVLGRRRIVPGRRVLLVGGTYAAGLAPPMGQLAEESSVRWKARSARGAPAFEAASWLGEEAQVHEAEIVLIALEAADVSAEESSRTGLAELMKVARSTSAEVLWLSPPPKPGTESLPRPKRKDLFPTETLVLARGPDGDEPTTIGFAGWAGAVWRWLG